MSHILKDYEQRKEQIKKDYWKQYDGARTKELKDQADLWCSEQEHQLVEEFATGLTEQEWLFGIHIRLEEQLDVLGSIKGWVSFFGWMLLISFALGLLATCTGILL